MPKKKQTKLPVSKVDTLVQAAYNKGVIDGARDMAQRAFNLMVDHDNALKGCIGLWAIGFAFSERETTKGAA